MCTYKSVGVIGHYWTDNFGDILLRDLMVEYLEKECNIENVCYINKNDYTKSRGKFGRFLYLLSFAVKCDFLVFSGGGYLESGSKGYKNTSILISFLSLAILTKILRKKYIIAGPGVGPDVSGFGGLLIKKLCNFSNGVIVRDNESKEILVKELKVKSSTTALADAALIVRDSIALELVKKDKKRIAIHLLLRGKEYVDLKEAIMRLLEVIPEKYEVIFVSDNGLLGEEIELINSNYPKAKIIEAVSTIEFINTLANCDYVLTTKLHVGIVSYSIGIPVFNIYRHPKCERFYKQTGTQYYSVNLENIGTEEVIEKFRNFCNDSGPEISRTKREEIIKDSGEIYNFVKGFL